MHIQKSFIFIFLLIPTIYAMEEGCTKKRKLLGTEKVPTSKRYAAFEKMFPKVIRVSAWKPTMSEETKDSEILKPQPLKTQLSLDKLASFFIVNSYLAHPKKNVLKSSSTSAFLDQNEKSGVLAQAYRNLLSQPTISIKSIKKIVQKKSIKYLEHHLKKQNSSVLLELADEDFELETKMSEDKVNTLVHYLVAEGVDVDATVEGEPVTFYFFRNGRNKLLKALLQSGLNVRARASDQNYNLLHRAARFRDRDIVALLLQRGADANALDSDKATPLHYLCEYDDDISKEDNEQIYKSCLAIVDLLIKAGAKINAQDITGSTPLHDLLDNFGKYYIETDFVKKLLDNGADPAIKREDGLSAVDLLRSKTATENKVDLMNLFQEACHNPLERQKNCNSV